MHVVSYGDSRSLKNVIRIRGGHENVASKLCWFWRQMIHLASDLMATNNGALELGI
jgi:hypothetical protein